MIDAKKVEIFVAIAEERSFTRAAKKLNLAQPWLSLQLRKLEKELGATLILRTTKTIELTEVGLEFFSIAKALNDAMKKAEHATYELCHNRQLSLNLGLEPYTHNIHKRNVLVQEFLRIYPNINLTIKSNTPNKLFEQLQEGQLDAVISSKPLPDFHVDYLRLYKSELQLLLPKEHSLARTSKVDLHDLKNSRIILMSSEYHTKLIANVGSFLEQSGVTLVRSQELDYLAPVRYAQLLRLPTVATMFPERFQEVPPDMVMREIFGGSFPVEWGILRRAGESHTALERLWTLAQSLPEFDAGTD